MQMVKRGRFAAGLLPVSLYRLKDSQRLKYHRLKPLSSHAAKFNRRHGETGNERKGFFLSAERVFIPQTRLQALAPRLGGES